MAKRRATVDNDHLTLVVGKGKYGIGYRVRLMSNYGMGIEEAVLVSQRYKGSADGKGHAVRSGQTLSKQLNVALVIED